MAVQSRDLKPLRPLGHLETFEAVRYARGLFSNVAMSAVYSNLTSTHDLKPLIFGAVARVIDRHPALSTVFMEANEGCKDPYYAQLSHIDLQDCTVFETWKWEDEESAAADEQRDKLLERYHNTRFDERWGELPLWRLVILQEPSDQSRFVACFVWQHTIGDGHTGPSFHHSFQAELSALSVNPVGVKDLENIVRPPKAAIPPSLESLHKLPLSPLYLLKMAWQDKFPNKSQAVWLGGPVTEPTRSRFRSFSLTTDTTSSLLAQPSPNKTRLKSSIAINLRRWISSDALKEDDMGNYVSTTYLDSKRPESMEGISWGEALRIKKLLDNEVKLGGKNASTGCLRWVDDMHKYFASKTGQPRDATFCLTNLGVFHPKNKDDANPPWSTEKMVFSEGFDAAREAMDVTMITGEDGRLTLGLIWGDGVVEEKLMLDIFDKLKNLVVATASQP